MTTLPKSLTAWKSDAFKSILKQELLDLNPENLPLEKGTSQGGYVDGKNLGATILSASDTTQTIIVTAGFFLPKLLYAVAAATTRCQPVLTVKWKYVLIKLMHTAHSGSSRN
ncbi:MAG: hypothetical protein GXP13_05240 [Gammaproteobacteria bacterium]|nr:hypothetical protein [Gammaproteobacteria bacterium]